MQIQTITSPPNALRQLIRTADSHKGLYGSVAILGGSSSMVGAALLAGRAALHLGAGKVWLGLLDRSISVDPIQPELMIIEPNRLFTQHAPTHLLIGPGLGQTPEASALLATCLSSKLPLIIDADGLNLIASTPELKLMLRERQAETLITPHPAEAARLLSCSTSTVQANRLQAITQLSQELNCSTVLKGHESLIYSREIVFKNLTGNPALSSAGQGDVLGGIILALWAQGLSVIDASCCGVYLHGSAADLWRNHNPNGIGLTGSETIHLARTVLNILLAAQT